MISLYNSRSENKKLGSSEISESNILNYKRRSRLVSYDSSKDIKKVKTIDTLKNCYNALYDLKNTLSDSILNAKDENRLLTLTEQYYLQSNINKTNTEILSVYHIFIKNVNLKDLTREEKKIIKNIDNINQVLHLLYNDYHNMKSDIKY